MTLEDLKNKINFELSKGEENISLIEIVNYILMYGFKSKASDIHIQPMENKLNIRYRIDGILYTIFTLPKYIQDELISRIKVLSGLRTDEHNSPQDGRFKFKILDENLEFDIRVSIMPTYYGENAVLRLLVQREEIFNLEKLGFF